MSRIGQTQPLGSESQERNQEQAGNCPPLIQRVSNDGPAGHIRNIGPENGRLVSPGVPEGLEDMSWDYTIS